MDETIRPLVILEDGKPADLAYTNEKGFKKSLENGILWTVHQETGRLLPYKERTTFSDLKDHGAWYSCGIAVSGSSRSQTESASRETENGNGIPESKGIGIIPRLAQVIKQRRLEMPEGSYTTHLFKSGLDKIRKKTGEEAVELILAREKGDILYEAADLVYHLLVLLEGSGLTLEELFEELAKRDK